jgi:pantoate--beta-alanine ligase
MFSWALEQKKKGRTIAFVPTMGCLHQGHVTLIRRAKTLGDRVVVSIYVNPAQFGKKEDFRRYPRDVRGDAKLLAREKADVLFAPENLYRKDACVTVEPGPMGDVLCGKSRPGHFRGVATVVLKLFNIVLPDIAVFGRKDAQQLAILEKMALDFNLPVKIMRAATVREKDGLAMSSRNRYLSASERKKAPSLYRALREVSLAFARGEKNARRVLARASCLAQGDLEYLEAVDRSTLMPVVRLKGGVLVAGAMRLGRTRLIDNLIL